MSSTVEALLIVWAVTSAIVFLICCLTVGDNLRPERDNKYIGWIGLLAPLWPITALIIIALVIFQMFKMLIEAARS